MEMGNFIIQCVSSIRVGLSYFIPALFFGVCIYLTIRLKAMPLRYIAYSLHLALRRQDDHAQGEISPFQAMVASQAMTIGLGSIMGAATAVICGGFGAVFWIALIGLLSLGVKFAEGLLSIKYRSINQRGEVCGGPM